MDNISIITIDGPSGAGKGTVSKLVAQALHFHYLDSGALYRIVAHQAGKHHLQLDDEEGLMMLIPELDIHFHVIKDTESGPVTRIHVNQEDVTQEIYTEDCGQRASSIAVLQGVRRVLLNTQRDFARPPGLVADGRDMGTVVFPGAPCKIFLTASLAERAKRRYLQLKDTDPDASIERICDSLAERDRRDESREAAPLQQASDARVIDTTTMTIPEVVETVLDYHARIKQN